MTGAASETVSYHAWSAEKALQSQGVTIEKGLTDTEAEARRARVGSNAIEARARTSLFVLLVHQLASPVVLLLAGAAFFALWFGEIEESIAIGIVLVLNTLIGFFTEYRAVRSIEALRALETPNARVRRNGHERTIPARDLVPGDIVLVEAGDAVPADLRIVDCANLRVDESTLTGESVAVIKDTKPVSEEARLGDRHSLLFKGTALTRGTALGVVVATGLHTELGKVSQLVAEAGAGASPIEKKLAHLSQQLVWAVLALAVVIIGVGLITGRELLVIIETGIALAVAAIPEGLPIVATLTLARGMWRMAQQNALVERLSAVETLGATTIIMTDKTGTLTENRMTVRQIQLPSGAIAVDDDDATSLAGPDAQLAALIEVAVLCNDAALDRLDDEGVGDPMELALLRAGLLAGQARSDLTARRPLVQKHAFDNELKMMATVHGSENGHLFAVKGAPEGVLRASRFVAPDGVARPMSDKERQAWSDEVSELARHGLRVLGFATKSTEDPDAAPYEDLSFLGLIGLEDPARDDVPEAIAACHRAGIRVVMVTGDHAVTARAIGRAVGLANETDQVAEGGDVAALAANGGFSRVGIFARVSPKEKLDLVKAYQGAGEIVAMTGDGVNDAPALRQADIGVAMGQRGTDVAREAAAMVLLDDAFTTIVAAIREGRVIFGNIRRFASYLLACNLTEVLVIGLAVLSTLPLPILPLQILYLNLITDVFPAFALALGEGEGDVLDRPPHDPKHPILGREQWTRILIQSALMTIGIFAALAVSTLWLGLDAGAEVTVTFLTLAFAQLWQVFNMRSDHSRSFVNEITRNPWVWAALALCAVLLVVPPYVPPVASVLGLVPPDALMWSVVFGFSIVPVLVWQTVLLLRAGRR